MPEELFDVYSDRNPETGENYLGDCSLHIGDGTQIVLFEKGLARVPRAIAELLLEKRGDVKVPALQGAVAPVTGDPLDALSPEERAAVLAVRGQQATREDPAGQRVGVELPADGQMREVSVDAQPDIEVRDDVVVQPAPPPAEPPHGAEPIDPSTPEGAEALAAAKAHLEEEGIEVPEPASESEPVAVGTDGAGQALVAKTGEDEPRCQAVTTGGTQCKNPAADGSTVCNLPAHQAQAAKPEDAK